MNRDEYSQHSRRIEQAMLEVLSRPYAHVSEREDAILRKRELRALFIMLSPNAALDLFRRFTASDDQLALALRDFTRRNGAFTRAR